MKKNTTQNNNRREMKSEQQRPENKDNLDSRKNEEQHVKGSDITHNKKETKTKHLKK